MRRLDVRRTVILRRSSAVGIVAFLGLGAASVSAHPLGNFSINHAHNFEFGPTTIVDRAIVDFAEIPTAQGEPNLDADADGQISPAEFAERGRQGCVELLDHLTLQVDGLVAQLGVVESSFAYREGQAGLPTGRLECRLEAEVDLAARHTIEFDDDFAADRVGWHEITATGTGVDLIDSPVPTTSGTDELRNYPVDLLASPLDVHSLQVNLAPGTGSTPPLASSAPTTETASSASPSLFSGGPLAGVVQRVTGRFDELVGRRDLTLGVGVLAVALAMILGASHALLPGHGKTVMAAYIAGRQGSSRDAVVVGATVTATHTGGVLLLGLALTLSSSLAGETVLGWLGVTSGLIITALGIGLLVNAAHHRAPVHGHRHSIGSRHAHGHGHEHEHSSVHRAPARRIEVRDRTRSLGNTAVLTAPAMRATTSTSFVVRRSPTKASLGTVESAPAHVSRRGLIGMGIAGGLVPSPSALIVLLSAIALGRTAFGVVLVIGYGLGMAATLTLAGLLLVRVRDRLQRRESTGSGRAAQIGRRWTAIAPYATATLVMVVGFGIAIRGVGSL